MEIDLRNFRVMNVDGSFSTVDVSQQFADLVYKTASGVAIATAAMDLYKTGKINVSSVKMADELIQVSESLAYWVRKPIVDLFNEAKESVKNE